MNCEKRRRKKKNRDKKKNTRERSVSCASMEKIKNKRKGEIKNTNSIGFVGNVKNHNSA